MRRYFAVLVAVALVLSLGLSPAWGAERPASPAIAAEAAVLIDGETGQVLAEKNSRRRMQPASLTKIMTCLLGMESQDPDARVAVTAEALRLMPGASAIGLQEGESLTMAQMLRAAMLPSANEAAAAVGIHLAGSSAAFAERMNQKAAELGLTGSHFANAHGLPARDHYSTAYDLAQITRAALAYPEFIDYAGSRNCTIPATQWNRRYSFSHLNRALRPGSGYYDRRAIAGKTGWTTSAGNCLMTVAEQDGVRLIAVVLKADNSTGSVYQDTKALFDYGFSAYRREEFPLPATRLQAILPTGAGGAGEEYCLTADGGTLGVLLPLGLGADGLVLETAGLEEGSAQGGAGFWARLVLRDGEGKVALEAGRLSLHGEVLAAEPLGPSPVVYLPGSRRRPEWWLAALTGVVCVVLFLAAKLLYRRRGAGEREVSLSRG